MPIKVECQSCGHRYQVGDNMAGKKVKCKTCGAVIAIPAGGEGDDFDFSPVDVNPASSAANRSRAGAAVPPPPRPARAEPDDEGEPAGSAGGAPAYGFAGSAVLEKVVPIVLVLAGLGWMAVQAYRAEDTQHGWVGPFRAAVYLLVYAAVVFPVTLAGVRAAGVKAYFAMPDDYKWRTFGLFCLPAALGAIFTLSGGGIGMLALGIVIGLIVSMALFVFLFNLRPQQVGKALSYLAPYAILGPVIGAVVLLGVSYLTMAGLTLAKTAYQYSMSPVGPQFSWQPPPAPVDQPKKKAGGEVVVVGPAVPDVPPTTNQSETTKPSAGSTTRPGEGTSIAKTGPATTQANQLAMNVPPKPEPKPEPPPVQVSPLLAGAPTPLQLGTIEDAYFAPRPGGAVTIVTLSAHTNFGDQFEVYNLAPGGAAAPEKSASFTAQPKTSDRYGVLLEATGKNVSMARSIEFPKLMIEVRTVAGDGPNVDPNKTKMLDPEPRGQMGLLGFSQVGQVIAWTGGGGGQPQVNAYDPMLADNGPDSQRLRKFLDIAGFTPDAHNIAITPGAHDVATIRYQSTPRPAMPAIGNYVVIDGFLGTGGFTNFALTNLQPTHPVTVNGLAFSPDGQRLALLYQDNGAGLIETYRVPSCKLISTHIFSGPAATAAKDFRGSAVTWIADGSSLLIDGRYVVDAEKFDEMGDLGVDDVKAVQVVDRSTLILLTEPANHVGPAANGAKPQVLLAKLSPEKFRGMAGPKPATPHGAAGAWPENREATAKVGK